MQHSGGPSGYSRGGGAGSAGGGSGYWNQSINPGPVYHAGQLGSGFDMSGGQHAGDPSAAAGDMSHTEGGVKGGGKNLEVVPVTIAEIVASAANGQDRLKIANVEVHRVTLVAQVRECRQSTTFITFLLDDKTGCTIEAKLWGDSQEELAAAVVGVGKYVRIYGTVKYTGENVAVTAYNIRPVQDINEVFFHMVDVIHSHAVLEKIAQHEATQTAGTQQMVSTGFVAAAPNATSTGLTAAPSFAGRVPPAPHPPKFTMPHPSTSGFLTAAPCAPPPRLNLSFPASGTQFIPDKLTPVQRAVYAYIRDNDDQGENGTDTRPMYGVLFPQFKSQQVIHAALQLLSAEGHIYETTLVDNYRVASYSNFKDS